MSIEHYKEQHYAIGSTLKAIGSNKVGGQLITYGSESQKDFDGDFFTKNTYFYGVEQLPMMYHHIKGNEFLKGPSAHLGKIRLTYNDVGIWAEGEIAKSDEYSQAIMSLAEQGKLRWSSGSAPHGSYRESNGEIKAWLMAEGSLAPTAKDYRNTVVPLKSFLDSDVEFRVSRQTLKDLKALFKENRSYSQTDKDKLKFLYDEIYDLSNEFKTVLKSFQTLPDVDDDDEFATAIAIANSRIAGAF